MLWPGRSKTFRSGSVKPLPEGKKMPARTFLCPFNFLKMAFSIHFHYICNSTRKSIVIRNIIGFVKVSYKILLLNTVFWHLIYSAKGLQQIIFAHPSFSPYLLPAKVFSLSHYPLSLVSTTLW